MTTQNANDAIPMFYINIGRKIRIWTEPDRPLRITSRKAMALLAIIVLSKDNTITRERSAALLWSRLERGASLDRLRNTLYQLRGVIPGAVRVDNKGISISPAFISVDISDDWSNDLGVGSTGSEFLADVYGVDPAFDQWITRVRVLRRGRHNVVSVAPSNQASSGPGAALGCGPSIVITALNRTGAHIEEGFDRSLTEQVGSALARLRWLNVIVRSTDGMTLSKDSPGLSSIATYALYGSVRQDGQRIQLWLSMMDLSRQGTVVWSCHFAHDVQLGISAEVALADSVAARIDSELVLVESRRRKALRSPDNDSPYWLTIEAVNAIYRLDRDPFMGAGHLLETAVLTDPEMVMSHIWLAYWHVFLLGQGWAANPHQATARATMISERAVMLDPSDARALTVMGHVKAFLGRQIDEGITLHQDALAINPALPLAWHLSGMAHAYSGCFDVAERQITHCLALAPLDPHAFLAEAGMATVKLLTRDHQGAVMAGRKLLARHPNFTSSIKTLLSALGHLGNRSEADQVIQRLRSLEPNFSLVRFISKMPYRRVEDQEHFVKGLRLAGVT